MPRLCPGADKAAGLIIATLGQDIAALTDIADAVEADAYTIQERNDPRRRWAVTPIPSREVRLESVKTISAGQMLPSAEESARLFAAANSGTGLNLPAGQQRAALYPCGRQRSGHRGPGGPGGGRRRRQAPTPSPVRSRRTPSSAWICPS